MKIVNLTPHAITIEVSGNGCNYGEKRSIVFASSGVARVNMKDEPASDCFGMLASDEPNEWPDGGCFNVIDRIFTDIVGLPEPADLTLYVVSMPVAQRAAQLGRKDVYAPDTGALAIRDDKGQVVAVRGLVRY